MLLVASAQDVDNLATTVVPVRRDSTSEWRRASEERVLKLINREIVDNTIQGRIM
ncbi:hypothetical protein HMI56_005740 [Coelomomyces lativittatus]|nr:hypothetical protein HMI56_005740 [Coelomomyces lativittatus]